MTAHTPDDWLRRGASPDTPLEPISRMERLDAERYGRGLARWLMTAPECGAPHADTGEGAFADETAYEGGALEVAAENLDDHVTPGRALAWELASLAAARETWRRTFPAYDARRRKMLEKSVQTIERLEQRICRERTRIRELGGGE